MVGFVSARLWKTNSILVNAHGEKGFAYPQFSLVIEEKKGLIYVIINSGMLKSLLNEQFFLPICSAQSN